MLTSDIVPRFRTADHDKDRSSHDVGRSHGSVGAIRELRGVMCFGTDNMLEHKGRTKMMPSQGSSSQALGRGHRRVNAIGES
jgi:hypothetical protein